MIDSVGEPLTAQVPIRNLDERVLTTPRRKAELGGRSFDRELRSTLSAAARLTTAERAASARGIRALTSEGAAGADSAEMLRADRDRG